MFFKLPRNFMIAQGRFRIPRKKSTVINLNSRIQCRISHRLKTAINFFNLSRLKNERGRSSTHQTSSYKSTPSCTVVLIFITEPREKWCNIMASQKNNYLISQSPSLKTTHLGRETGWCLITPSLLAKPRSQSQTSRRLAPGNFSLLEPQVDCKNQSSLSLRQSRTS